MAETATIETMTRQDRREERRVSAEQEHKKRIAENYRKLLFDNGEDWAAGESQMQTRPQAAAASAAAPAATATLERTPVMPARETIAPVHESVAPAAAAPAAPETDVRTYSVNTAQRIADYVGYAPAKGKKVLFEGLAIKDGELVDLNAPAAALPAAPAMPAMPVMPAPAEVPAAPVFTPSEEDALPTRRTLDTLRRTEQRTAEQTNTSLMSALSLRTKLVLCAIAAAIVLVIALICVNTGILSSANADSIVKESRLRDLQTQYAQMQEELDYITSPEYIDAWAQQNGMVMGD